MTFKQYVPLSLWKRNAIIPTINGCIYQFWITLQKKVNLIKKNINQEQIHLKQNGSFDITVGVGIEATDFNEILWDIYINETAKESWTKEAHQDNPISWNIVTL